MFELRWVNDGFNKPYLQFREVHRADGVETATKRRDVPTVYLEQPCYCAETSTRNCPRHAA